MMDITVENIKCSGCAGTISKKLNAKFNTESVKVNVETGIVSIDIEENKRDEATKTLLDLGYPETDSVHGLGSVKVKAKSFVSCAIGKMNQ